MTFSFLSKAPGEIQEIIAGRLRQIRRKRKISQKKLSELSGVSLGSVKRFEKSGSSNFRLTMIRRISENRSMLIPCAQRNVELKWPKQGFSRLRGVPASLARNVLTAGRVTTDMRIKSICSQSALCWRHPTGFPIWIIIF